MTLIGIGVLAACTPPETEPPPVEPPPVETEDTDPPPPPQTTPTGDTATTGTTADTAPPPTLFDCEQELPTSPLSRTEIPAAKGSYDLIFDDAGYIYGWDNGLKKADYYGNSQMVSPALGNIQGMAWLADGDLAVSEINTEAILRVNVTTGAVALLSTDVNAYGLKMGPDGMLWAGSDDAPGGGKLIRVDPNTGDREVLVADPRFNVRSIDFAPDFSKIYMGTYFGDGRFWAVDLDANYDVTGDPYVFRPDIGGGVEHDALGVDYCGNVFVVDYQTMTLYHIPPDGSSTRIFTTFSGGHYGHGITWGSGVGGWKPTAIYFPEPWYGNTVFEVDVGVPGRTYGQ